MTESETNLKELREGLSLAASPLGLILEIRTLNGTILYLRCDARRWEYTYHTDTTNWGPWDLYWPELFAPGVKLIRAISAGEQQKRSTVAEIDPPILQPGQTVIS